MGAARVRTVFRCQACGHEASRWHGRCAGCGEWNSLVEERVARAPTSASAAAAARGWVSGQESGPVGLDEVVELPAGARIPTGLGELDRVLGGGLVPGSLTLLGGDPGIGKSTLLSQMLHGVAVGTGSRVLYTSGEESVRQVAMRARRVGATAPTLALMAETAIERILAEAERAAPALLAIDSVQTVHTADLSSIPGSIGQVRECAGRLLGFAKQRGIAVVLVGHVTKDGHLAGPRTLEHMVDVVLQFEGDGAGPHRIVRAAKNRFGSTQEIGVFEMRSDGLAEVLSPSELFLAERPAGAPGSVVVASADGARPILVEVQALVAPAAAGFGRRTAAGVDHNRVSLLLAVLAQRAACDVLDQDVFVNLAGGARLGEPAVDLGIALAIASAARGRAVEARTAVFGEVGLAGEVRAVSLPEIRLAECAKLGFTRCLLPRRNLDRLTAPPDLEVVAVDSLTTALQAL